MWLASPSALAPGLRVVVSHQQADMGGARHGLWEGSWPACLPSPSLAELSRAPSSIQDFRVPRAHVCLCVSSPSLRFHSFFSGSQRALGVHGSGMHSQLCRVWFQAGSVPRPRAPSVSTGGGGGGLELPPLPQLLPFKASCGSVGSAHCLLFPAFSLFLSEISSTPEPPPHTHSVTSWRVLSACCLRWSVCWDKP